MARNSEKAQSMLYRFREQQAVEMGLGNRTKGDRRPRMASSVSSLRECERWRGDIMRDISRKVSKIQDPALTDYEIRDLNDEINSLMREKRHWETQIVALGGANYKRGQAAMTDEDGREVPGTRGYKYFGRAKDLPGVKELFQRGAQQATEESARNASFQMFRHQGPAYYGDVDEADEALAQEEEELARREWEEAARETAAALGLPDGTQLPAFPSSGSSKPPPPEAADEEEAAASKTTGKRKAAGGAKGAKGKKAKKVNNGAAAAEEEEQEHAEDGEGPGPVNGADPQAALAARFFGPLDPESLKMPRVPTQEEMGQILLDVRKKAIMEEYGVQ